MSVESCSPVRRWAAAIGITALLATAGCGGSVPGSAMPAGDPPSLELKPTEGESGDESEGEPEESGYDECALVEPSEVADALGLDSMYVTSRSTMGMADGSLRASCAYFPEDIPGMLGMEINTVVGTDADRFFAAFEKYEKKESIDKLGERAEAVAYTARGTSTHFIEIRTIVGDQGVHLFYTYRDDGGIMPKIEGSAAAVILSTAMERLPDEVTIPDGTPQGDCAEVDVDLAGETVGTELGMARSVVSDGDAMSCYFSGDGAAVEVIVVADPDRVEQMAIAPTEITHDDIGGGARLIVTEANSLDARIDLGDRLVVITAVYAEEAGTVTEPRPDDVELVRSIAESLGEQN